MNHHRRKFIDTFLQVVHDKYAIEINVANANSKLSATEKEMVIQFLESDYTHKVNIYKTYQQNVTEIKLPQFNQYCPTSVFSFHKRSLSVDTMRLIMKDLRNFLSLTVDKSIAKDMDYENIFVRGIERGIILHSNILPIPFQRVVQELISSDLAPICFADGSLKYGVNLPTRTVVILGNQLCETINVLDAQQMSGRSGRRGYDTQGHVVYCRVNYKDIMRGTYAPLIGGNTMTPYTLLPAKIFKTDCISKTYIERVISLPLNMYMSNNSTEWNICELFDGYKELYQNTNLYNQPGLMLYMLWLFRDDVYIAPNIFMLLYQLINIAANKVIKKPIAQDAIHPYIEDEAHITRSLHIAARRVIRSHSAAPAAEKETRYIYDLPPITNMMVIELLFRVFDRDDEEDDDDEIAAPTRVTFISNDPTFNNMLVSEIWACPLNMKNNNLIRRVINNQKITANETFGETADIVNRLHIVILRTLRLYNVFAENGDMRMISILDSPLTKLIAYLNQLKSLN